ncbi:MAG: hypothetical protein FWH27_03675 [Planctomycetaceae bacterium]|nr:hypothetical protein [Planctomycetaceae bacterium]
MNKLLLGDNLEVLKTLDEESVDLIYLDPPFFSNRNYEVIWGDEGEIRSFQDRWSGGIDHYIYWLKERVGYPTQKPEALLDRIIKCAVDESDIVLDPFVGGGTTVAVAGRLNRQRIGIDQSVQAVKVTELRLDKQGDLFSVVKKI